MSNNNSNECEWRTVGGSRNRRPEAPAAFGRAWGSNTSEQPDRRREHDRANAEAEAARAYREQKAKREAEVKECAALAFDSESAYPSLGNNSGARAQTITTMNFSKTVADMAEREREAAILMQQRTAAAEEAFDADEFYARGIRRRAQLGTRCYDNGPEDYNGPEEFNDDEDEYEEESEVNEDEDNGEFNAHLAETRRRGDKGIW